jgi:hypothetical protein
VPFNPAYPQLRGTDNAIMEHNPPAEWVELAQCALQYYRVPQEIKDAFVGWLEDERRKVLGNGVPPGTFVPADFHSIIDKAFPEPPFAEALGLPKVNNPPFGDAARRLGLTFPQAPGVRGTEPGTINWTNTSRVLSLDVSGNGLATRLFAHYEGGSGSTFVLNYDDMEALRPTNVSPTQSPEFHASSANAAKEAWEKGRPVSVAINVGVQTKANAIMTLNTFTVHHLGVLTVSLDGSWSYVGHMTYSDTFNFEDHPNVDNPAEPNPDGDEEARNFQAAIVRNTITLYGSPFEVRSAARMYAETSESPSQELPWLLKTKGLTK